MEKHFHRKKSCEKRCKICTCTNILLFGAPWLANGMFLAYYNPIFVPLAHVKVKDIINQFDKVCNAPLIYNMFDLNTAQLILNTLLHLLVDEDKLIFKTEKNDMYSVHNAYRLCVNR